MKLSCEDLAILSEALEESPYRTLRVEAEGYALCLRRDDAGWSAETLVRADEAAASEGERVEVEDDGSAIRAPMVGVFYRAPKPGDPPFVEVGGDVTPDTIIGIIETMKLMNSIPAGIGGRIAEIVASDAAFVDAGHVLMRIEQEPA